MRLWPGKRLSQLWQRLRSEAISPPPHFTKRKDVRADTGVRFASIYAYLPRTTYALIPLFSCYTMVPVEVAQNITLN